VKIEFLNESPKKRNFENLIYLAPSMKHRSIPQPWQKVLLERSEALRSNTPSEILAVDMGPRQRLIYVCKKTSTLEALTQAKQVFAEALSGSCQIAGEVDAQWVDAFVAAAVVTSWQRPSFKSKKDDPAKNFELCFIGKNFYDIAHKAQTLSHATNLVRELALLPANSLTPKSYQLRIKKELTSQGSKVKHRNYSYNDLLKMKAGAFCAVAQGSPQRNDTGIVHLSYSPKGSKDKKLIIVGKGITYDTGGVSLKPPKYMFGMQNDMTGSAVALALFKALIELKFPVEMDCYLAITDNAISKESYTPNEVVYALNGSSIETVHTDAEGRMVLADTLCLVSKTVDVKKHPKTLILDFATLTGSAVGAVGTSYSCVFANNAKLHNNLIDAGVQSGERVWPFPSSDDYLKGLKSDIADIKQCRLEGGPDHIEAFMFLKSFVTASCDYVHVDLSACENEGGLAHVPTKTTGFGVRFATTFVEKYFGL
jgi:leucyl aminopeptidase